VGAAVVIFTVPTEDCPPTTEGELKLRPEKEIEVDAAVMVNVA
jgi:hypothetical protein